MWMISESAGEQLAHAIAANFQPSASQVEAFGRSRSGNIMSRDGATATIDVKGVLTKEPDIMAAIFGGGNTTYTAINEALATAEADPKVSEITLNVDSPGGNVNGLFSTIDAIKSTKKPVNAVIDGMAASAAYGLVSQADKIEASERSSAVGSVGVVRSFLVSDRVVDVTSSNAPNKRPDVRTDEGKKAIQAELDEYENLFVSAIAEGRGISDKKVKADFGKGSMFLAETALERGMIDAIQTNAASSGKATEAMNMDLNQLKAEHPQAYAAAKAEILAEERDRVGEYLVAGEASGKMDLAIEAIKSGSEMTKTQRAEFMFAARDKSDIEAMADDETDAADSADQSEPNANAEYDAAFEKEFNLKLEG